MSKSNQSNQSKQPQAPVVPNPETVAPDAGVSGGVSDQGAQENPEPAGPSAADLEAQNQAAAVVAAAVAANPAPVAGRQAEVEVEGHVAYVTPEKHSVPFDIQISNQMISGNWSAKDGVVEFSVPESLVEGFEKHYHFVSGNVIRAAK
jgi:hypothetical protein